MSNLYHIHDEDAEVADFVEADNVELAVQAWRSHHGLVPDVDPVHVQLLVRAEDYKDERREAVIR